MESVEIKPRIRWLIRRDLPEVLEIESACYEFAWTEEDFLCCFRREPISCIGMVAEHNDRVVGFMVYELHKIKLRIINFAVAPNEQRRGIGRQMIWRLVEKLAQQYRKEIELEVRGPNLSMQLFLRSQGFKATCVLRNYYEDNGDDAYSFSFYLED